MEAMREGWTDDRMDDFNTKVDRIDADVRALRIETKTEFAAVRSEMREGFARIEKRFDKVDARFEKVDERFDRMNDRLVQICQTMIGFCGVAFAALIGFLATQI